MHSRLLLGIAAWLVGASAATGGSLLAVSALGQGMSPTADEQVSVETVNRALAKEAAERTAAIPRRSVPPTPHNNGGTVLTSQGGTLVASCAGARAYVVSWSPQQGFASTDVVRGPATKAQVTFAGGQLTVTMVVACDAGVPTATSTAVSTWAGDGE